MADPKKTITRELLLKSFEKASQKRDLSEILIFQLAALYDEFELEKIENYAGKISQEEIDKADIELLENHVINLDTSNIVTLEEHQRSSILQKMAERKVLTSLVEKAYTIDSDSFLELLYSFLVNKAPHLKDQTVEQLVTTHRISSILKEKIPSLPNLEQINAFIKREELLQPFRTITKNFQGREDELKRIEDYIDILKPKRFIERLANFVRKTFGFPVKSSTRSRYPLLIHGIGGIGKSTLIAKFILKHHLHDQANRIPFIYLDFDKPGLSISEPLNIAVEGLRQLATQFPSDQIRPKLEDIRSDIRNYLSAIKRKERDSKGSRSLERENIYESISRQYLNENAGFLGGYITDLEFNQPPILLILDSFEEAQFRASTSELKNLDNFLQEISTMIPGLRTIIAGRDEQLDSFFRLTPMKIPEFGKKEATGFLASKEILDEDLAGKIFEHVGGNPLSLKLAAHYLKLLQAKQPDKLGNIDSILSEIDKGRVQEQLVRRNLLHIKDKDAQKLAFPGMIVRKINEDIIRKVLAIPCGLGKISPNTAKSIFESLRKESFLTRFDKGNLVFRNDLRVALYDLIIQEYEEKAREIHDRAVKYYQNKDSISDKAEQLYHQLKRGDDVAIINTMYHNSMRPYIENALPEFSDNARAFLAARMGIRTSDAIVSATGQREWEEYTTFEIKDVLENGDKDSLIRIKEKLLDRKEKRTLSSPLSYYEVKVHLRLGDFDKAHAVLNVALKKNPNQLSLNTLKALILEYDLKFRQAYSSLESTNIDHITSISELIEYSTCLTRLTKRTDRSSWQAKEIIRRVKAKYKPHLSIDIERKESPQNKLSHFDLPIYYRNIYFNNTSNFSQQLEDSEWSSFDQMIESIYERSLSGKNILELNRNIDKGRRLQNKVEDRLFNELRIAVKDVSEPGTVQMILWDLIFYLEQKGGEDALKKVLIGKAQEEKRSKSIFKFLRSPKFLENKTTTLKSGGTERVKNLIAEARTKEAIDSLENLVKELNDSRWEKDVILIRARYNEMESSRIKGIVKREDSLRENARLTESILHILDRLKKYHT